MVIRGKQYRTMTMHFYTNHFTGLIMEINLLENSLAPRLIFSNPRDDSLNCIIFDIALLLARTLL